MRKIIRPSYLVLCAALLAMACERGSGSVAPGASSEGGATGGSCRDFEQDVERVWSSERRREIQLGAVTLGGEFARKVVERVSTGMDVFARSWVMMKENACKDCVHRKLLSAEAYNRIASCLDTTLVRQQTLIALLENPDSDTLTKADELAMTISSELQACRDAALDRSYAAGVDAYTAEITGRSAPKGESQELAEALARAKTLRGALKPAKALDIVEDVLRRARGLDDAALIVAALLEASECRIDQGKYQQAEQDAREAVRFARDHGDGPNTARALTEHAFALMGTGQDREALAVGVAAEQAAGREWAGAGAEYARAAHYLAMAYANNSAHDEALRWYRKALAIQMKTLGTEHPDTARTMHGIGVLYLNKGAYDRALRWYRKALAIRMKTLGTEHPDTASTMNNIGLVYLKKGAHDEALGWFRKALAIDMKTLGTEHPDTAHKMNNIGIVYLEKGAYDEALGWYRKALAIYEKTRGTEHPDTASTMHNIGVVYKKEGAYDEALGWFRKALAIYEKTQGTEHPHTTSTRNQIRAAGGEP